MRLFFLIFIVCGPLFAGAQATDPASELRPFLGCFRTVEYNGTRNVYSKKFFVPSISIEPSIKLRNERGESLRTFDLNFEVPVQEAGGIALRFIFLEIPVDGSRIQTLPTGETELAFEGRLQERQGENWVSCAARSKASLRWAENALLAIELRTENEAPCTSGHHKLSVSKVDF